MRLILFVLSLIFFSCSDSVNHSPQDIDIAPDIDSDMQTRTCPDADYPQQGINCSSFGDIACNLCFTRENNTQYQLADLYKNRNLIWLAVSTYDCSHCQAEKLILPALYTEQRRQKGFEIILLMNGYLEPVGPRPQEEPALLIHMKEDLVHRFGDQAEFIYGYLDYQAQTELKKYSFEGYPLNLLIDGQTMKILEFINFDPQSKQLYSEKIDRYLNGEQ